jgi:DNA polymerase III gamma/tau subunit
MQLFEKYRPKSFAEMVGQSKAVAALQAVRDKGGFGGLAIFLSGGSGSGKTSAARIIAAEVASDWATVEVEAGKLTPKALNDIAYQWRYAAMGKGGWALIVNESHKLRADTLTALNVALEPLPAHVVVIFTTTAEGKASLFEDQEDAGPFLSRCLKVALARRDLCEPFADRAREIATQEGLNGQPRERYIRLAKECGNNLRDMLTRIQMGELKGD